MRTEPKLQTGKVYEVTHSANGIFTGVLVGHTDDWITAIIVPSIYGTMARDGWGIGEGGEVSVRLSQCSNIKEILQ